MAQHITTGTPHGRDPLSPEVGRAGRQRRDNGCGCSVALTVTNPLALFAMTGGLAFLGWSVAVLARLGWAVPGCSPPPAFARWRCTEAAHISTNDLHCCKHARCSRSPCRRDSPAPFNRTSRLVVVWLPAAVVSSVRAEMQTPESSRSRDGRVCVERTWSEICRGLLKGLVKNHHKNKTTEQIHEPSSF